MKNITYLRFFGAAMTWTIKVLSHGKTVSARKKQILSDILREAGIPVSLYCNKRGLCGKCFVEIVKGRRPSPGEKEKYWLEQKKLGDNFRLSCQFEVRGSLEINVPASFTLQEIPILPSISRAAVRADPAVKKYYLELHRPMIASPDSLYEILLDALGAEHLRIPLEVLRDLERNLEKGNFKVTAVVHLEKDVISVEPGNSVGRTFGLAVDVGTTTLVMDLVDLDSGKTLDTEAALNSQVSRGADVVSRISYAFGDPARAAELRKMVLETLNGMIGRLLARNRVDRSSVYEVVVAGNTVMSHILVGVPLNSLATAPYQAVFSRLPDQAAREFGFAVHPQGKVNFSPNIMSFVGGDISSGLLASRIAWKRGRFLFLDLGTNGEIVLKAGDRLVTTSTAAGPAFEGMNISCGMPALPGAVYKVEVGEGIRTHVLTGVRARGICGTGLIDLIAVLLERGEISPRGVIQNEAKKIPVTENILLTQEDVRQMQLACAAVKTGIRIILQQNRLTVGDVDGIYIAGAFGNYLNIRNSMAIGLLPRIDESKVIFIGNSSLAGARQLLLSRTEREKVAALVRKIRYVSLAADPHFREQFILALDFRAWP
jgi:uncharacterized 2Fe-2S/4Fe-4S cluster protein (DUF4445 family)